MRIYYNLNMLYELHAFKKKKLEAIFLQIYLHIYVKKKYKKDVPGG